MQLAAEEIIVSIGNTSIELVPSLRAALRVARRHDGFAAPIRAILAGDVRIMASLIRDGADQHHPDVDLLEEIGVRGLGITLASITEPLAAFVLALAGHDPDAPDAKPSGNPIPFTTFFERLFGIATGALGWTPDVAWSATPAEILAAYAGRQDLLKQIFGSAETETLATYTPPVLDAAGTDPAFDRAGFQALKAKIAR